MSALIISQVEWVRNSKHYYREPIEFCDTFNIVVADNWKGKSTLRRALAALIWDPDRGSPQIEGAAKFLHDGVQGSASRVGGLVTRDSMPVVNGGADYVFDLRQMLGVDTHTESLNAEMNVALLGGYSRQKAMGGFDRPGKIPDAACNEARKKLVSLAGQTNALDEARRKELLEVEKELATMEKLEAELRRANAARDRRAIQRRLAAAKERLAEFADFAEGLRFDDSKSLTTASERLTRATDSLATAKAKIAECGLQGDPPTDDILDDLHNLSASVGTLLNERNTAEGAHQGALAESEAMRTLRADLDGLGSSKTNPEAYGEFRRLVTEHGLAFESVEAWETVKTRLGTAPEINATIVAERLKHTEEWLRTAVAYAVESRKFAEAVVSERERQHGRDAASAAGLELTLLIAAVVLIGMAILLAAMKLALFSIGAASLAAVFLGVVLVKRLTKAAAVTAPIVYTAPPVAPTLLDPPMEETTAVADVVRALRSAISEQEKFNADQPVEDLRKTAQKQLAEHGEAAERLRATIESLTGGSPWMGVAQALATLTDQQANAARSLAHAESTWLAATEAHRKARAALDARFAPFFPNGKPQDAMDRQLISKLNSYKVACSNLASARQEAEAAQAAYDDIVARTGHDDPVLLRSQCARHVDWMQAKADVLGRESDLAAASPDVEGSDEDLEALIGRLESARQERDANLGRRATLTAELAMSENFEQGEAERKLRDAEVAFEKAVTKALDHQIADDLLKSCEEKLAANQDAAFEAADNMMLRVMGYRLRSGAGGVHIQDGDGIETARDALSDGARVQVAMIFRLAALRAKEQGARAPLFFDEATATSDVDREAALAAAVAEFVKESPRQVFVFTNRRSDAGAWKRAAAAAGHPVKEIDLGALWHGVPFRDDRAEDPSLRQPIPDDPFACGPLDPYSEAIPLALLFDEEDREVLAKMRRSRLDCWHQAEPELREEPRYEDWKARTEFLAAAREAFRIGRPRGEVTLTLLTSINHVRETQVANLFVRYESLALKPAEFLKAACEDRDFQRNPARPRLIAAFEERGWTDEGLLKRDGVLAEATRQTVKKLDTDVRARLVDLLFRAPEDAPPADDPFELGPA